MDEQPHHPAREPAQPQAPDTDDRLEAADGRRAAQVPVGEGNVPRIAPQAPTDRVGGMQAALHGHLAHPRELVDGGHVAEGEHLRMPR